MMAAQALNAYQLRSFAPLLVYISVGADGHGGCGDVLGGVAAVVFRFCQCAHVAAWAVDGGGAFV